MKRRVLLLAEYLSDIAWALVGLRSRCILHTFAGLPSWRRVAWSCLMLVGTTARLWSFPISWYMNPTLRTNGGLSILEAPKRQRQLAIAQPTPILGEPHHAPPTEFCPFDSTKTRSPTPHLLIFLHQPPLQPIAPGNVLPSLTLAAYKTSQGVLLHLPPLHSTT